MRKPVLVRDSRQSLLRAWQELWTRVQPHMSHLKHMTIMFAATSLNNVFGYVFVVVMGRMLTPVGFGSLVAVQALFDLMGVAASSLRTLVTVKVSSLEASGQRQRTHEVLRQVMKWTLGGTLPVVAALLVASSLIMRLLKLDSPLPVVVAALGLIPTMTKGLLTGFFQGLQQFEIMGGMEVATGALRVVVGYALVAMGLNVTGAVAALPAASSAATALGLYAARRSAVTGPSQTPHSATEVIGIRPLSVISGLVLFAILTQLDMVLVKLLFSPELASEYAVAVTLGKIIFFFPMAVASVLLPKTARSFTLNRDAGPLMQLSLLAVIIPCGLITGLYVLFPAQIVHVVLGSQHAVNGAILGVVAAAMTFRAVINLWINYTLATNGTRFLYVLLGGVIAQLGLVGLFHESLMQVAIVLAVAAFAVSAVGYGLFLHDQGLSSERA